MDDCNLAHMLIGIPYLARVLHFVPYKSTIRRDWTQHLQALPSLWQRNMIILTTIVLSNGQ